MTLSEVVIGALGAVGGYALKVLSGWYARHDVRRNVANALAAEINGHVTIFRTNGGLEEFRKIHAKLSRGEDVIFPPTHVDNAKQDPLFEKHLGELGSLGSDLAARVNLTYQHARGLRECLKLASHGTPTIATKEALVRQMITYAEAGMPLADAVDTEIVCDWWNAKPKPSGE